MPFEWFPDVPPWIVIAAFAGNGAVILFILATLVASPIDAWHAWQDRGFRRDSLKPVGIDELTDRDG